MKSWIVRARKSNGWRCSCANGSTSFCCFGCPDSGSPVAQQVRLIDGFVPFFAALDPQKAGPWGFRLDTEDLPSRLWEKRFSSTFLSFAALGQRTTTRADADRSRTERSGAAVSRRACGHHKHAAFLSRPCSKSAPEAKVRGCAFHLGSAETDRTAHHKPETATADELGLPGARPLGMVAMGAQASETCFCAACLRRCCVKQSCRRGPVSHGKNDGLSAKLAVAVGGFFCLLGSMFLGGRYSRAVLWLFAAWRPQVRRSRKGKTTTLLRVTTPGQTSKRSCGPRNRCGFC